MKKRRLAGSILITMVAAGIVIIPFVLSGSEYLENSPGILFRWLYMSTEAQVHTRWIIIWESILILFLLLLVVLLIALFTRYQKREKQVIEAVIREKTLVKENEILDNLNQTKTEFLLNMSHDLKTPLTVISTSILNTVDMLDFEIDKNEIRESLTLAQSEIMRLSRIVEEAIKHAAQYSEKKQSESVDLNKLLAQIKKMYNFFLERYGNVLTISIPKEIPNIYGNTDVLINIFSNLISNANRFTKYGEITISAQMPEDINPPDEPGFVEVSVRDTGRGISPDLIYNIFERGTSETGSGLGLAICKRAIETYGGTISAKSEKGRGTELTFTLPVYNQSSDN